MDEEAQGTKQKKSQKTGQFFISLSRLIRMSSGFFLSAFILFLSQRISLFDISIIIFFGMTVSYFLVRDEAVIISQLVNYFRNKAASTDPASSIPKANLNRPSFFNSTNEIAELRWLVSSAEQQAARSHKNLVSENIYRSEILKHLPLPLMLLNDRGYVEEFNEPAQLLFSHISISKPIDFIVRNNQVLQKIRQVSKGHFKTIETEMTLRESPNRHFAVLISQFSTGDVQRIAVILIDRSAAIEAEKMRADFVANVSHELRTPLTSILGFVETLQGPAGEDNATRKKFLAILQQQSERMIRLVADQLSLSHIERIENVQPESIVDLTIMAERVKTGLEPQALKAGVTLNLAAPEQPVFVRGEADELTQMIQNLTENALRYGRKNGTVNLIINEATSHPKFDHEGTCCSISVNDDGEGIAEEHLPRLTERFYRVDTGRSREMGGTGLGLAIVKHIVNRHRGMMDVTSRLGHGTSFSIYLGIAQPTDLSLLDETAERQQIQKKLKSRKRTRTATI